MLTCFPSAGPATGLCTRRLLYRGGRPWRPLLRSAVWAQALATNLGAPRGSVKDCCGTDNAGWLLHTPVDPAGSNFSFTFTVKPTASAAPWKTLFCSGAYSGTGNAADTGVWILLDGDRKVRVYLQSAATMAEFTKTFTTALTAGVIYHLAFVFNRVAGTVELFVNGLSDGTGDISAHTAHIHYKQFAYIGAIGDGSAPVQGYSFDGHLCQIGYWSRVLAGTEVTALYNAGLGRYWSEMTASQRLGCIHFWDGTGSDTALVDQCAGNTGIMQSSNLVPNGYFLADANGEAPLHWTTPAVGGLVVWDTWDVQSHKMRLVDSTATSLESTYSDAVPVIAGRSYLYGFTVELVSGAYIRTYVARTSNAGSETNGFERANYAVTTTVEATIIPTWDNAYIHFYCNTAANRSWLVSAVYMRAAGIPTITDADLVGSGYLAPSNGDAIGTWASGEGNAYSLAQATAAYRPAFSCVSSLPSPKFDGTNDYLRCTTTTPLTGTEGLLDIEIRPCAIASEACVVGTADEAAANKYLFCGIDAAGKVFVECNDSGTIHRVTGHTVLVAGTEYHIQAGTDGTAWWIRVDGVLQALTVIGANSGKWFGDIAGLDAWTVGALVLSTGATKFFGGLIAEMDWCNSALPAANAGHIRNYYARRYAGPYVFRVQLHCHSYLDPAHPELGGSTDGHHSAAVIAAAYLAAGAAYEVVAITDHCNANPIPITPPPDVPGLLMPGIEDARYHHLTRINALTKLDEVTFNEQYAIDFSNAEGSLIILDHPKWPPLPWTEEEALAVHGYDAIEVWNALLGSAYGESYGNAESLIDALLTVGHHFYLLATDDCHNLAVHGSFDHGWVQVFAHAKTTTAIMAALKSGDFYASSGPTLMNISRVGSKFTVSTDFPSTVEFIRAYGVVVQTATSAKTSTYTILGTEGYVRCRVTRDSDGTKAWTNPVWV